jgi:hypothetical protein
MVYNTRDYRVFGPFPSSGILNDTTFRKLNVSVQRLGLAPSDDQAELMSPTLFRLRTEMLSF